MFLKRCYAFNVISLGFLILILFAPQHSSSAERRLLSWGTTATTSGQFTYYVTTAKILNEKIPEINVNVRSTGGGVHNTRLLEKREIEIGGIDTMGAWQAIQGKGPFKDKPFTDLRLLHLIATNPVQFVVSEKSGVKNVHDLEGKLFCPGHIGGSAEEIGMDILSSVGVHPNIRRSSMADAVEAMKNGMIIGFHKMVVPDAVVLDIASAMKIRILSFNDEDIQKILRNVPGLRKIVVPSGIYPGVGEFQTVENEWCNYVRKDFPVELAYKIVKTIWENTAEISKVCPTSIGDRYVEVALGVKLSHMHPGAIKFYRELGFTVPKTLIPPEMGEK